ncbi:hypothetical protein GGH96_003167 [Coemansia sp. RSA 1972]|nr:hypothetical protein GGH96_003167 [Coemansia sp. RSA 1972]
MPILIALSQLAVPDKDALNPAVTTAEGFSIRLSDLVEFTCSIQPDGFSDPKGLRIENYNVALGGIGTDVVMSCVREKPTAHKLICLEDGRSIAVPVDRYVLTDDGWVQVARLREGDKVTCGSTYGVEPNLIDLDWVYESDRFRLSAMTTLEARQAMAFA